MPADHRPPVFTLVWPAVLNRYGQRPDAPAPRLLLFRRAGDGRVTVTDFPDEVDACPKTVAALDPAVVRIERERLYVAAANGTAVYVPVGPSPLPGCVRYGRLYLRRSGG